MDLNVDVLSPMHFNYALDCTVSSVQVIQDGLKLNGIREYQVKCIERKRTYYKGKIRSVVMRVLRLV